MVDLAAGGYTEESGWLGRGHARRRPTVWIDRWQRADGAVFRAWATSGPTGAPVFAGADIIDTRVDARRASGEDPRSYTKRWMELGQHLQEAEKHATTITGALKLPPDVGGAVRTAVRWHDVGKALEREINGQTQRPFQNMLLEAGVPEHGDPRSGLLYAKSNRRGGPPAGFRHEVASALAYLAGPDVDDLVAYLIGAHHGKVRLLPSPWNDDEPWDANGVRLYDRVPVAALPCETAGEPVRLDPALFLSSPLRPGWQGRIARLLDRLGPFELAYLEALVRIADWRAS